MLVTILGCGGETRSNASVLSDLGIGSKPAPFTEAEQVVELVNNERAANGLAPLTLQAQLSSAAQAYAEAMASQGYADRNHSRRSCQPPPAWNRIVSGSSTHH
jgi:uncharacterized protein YkwD